MKFLIEKGDKNVGKAVGSVSSDDADSSFFFYNIQHPCSRTQCDECKRDISKTAAVLLLIDNTYKDLCLSCFATFQSYQGQYRIANKLDFALLEQEWTANEQLLLFQGLQTHGYGNWSEIALFIGTSKTRQQVESHYERTYLRNQSFMPVHLPLNQHNHILSKRNQEGILVSVEPDEQMKRNLKRETRYLGSISESSNVAGSRKARGATTSITQSSKQSTNPAEVVGFMPRRGDFEVEYDNDAELLLAEMEFNDDDTEEEKAMKFRLIDIYNHKLTERIKRKEFVISRKLLDIRQQMRLDKTRTKEQKEIYNLMKVVARFHTPQEHDRLVQRIIKQKQIRQRIAELKELQSKGFRTFGDVEDELQGKKRKDDKSKKREDFPLDKSKTRRVARKDPTSERADKRVLYISKEEEELCKKLNMTFRQYTNIKENILREAIRNGVLKKDETTQKLSVSRRSAEAIFDFLVEQEGLVSEKGEKMQVEV